DRGNHDRISAGRSALWIERGGAAQLLPHQAGPVGDLLLGQAGDASHAARLVAEPEGLRQRFRRARHRLRPFRLRRRARHARHVVLHAARRPRGGGRIRRWRAHEQGRPLPARRDSPLVEQLREAPGRLSPQGPAAVPVHGTQDRHTGVLPRPPPRARVILRVVRRQLHLSWTDPLGRRRRQHRHRAAARAAGPGGGGQVLERGAVCQERRISEGRAHHALGVRGLTGAGIDGSTDTFHYPAVPRDLLATSSREKSSSETMSPPRMKLFRRTFLRLAVGAAALPAVSHIARAQTYPARPIRLVVPFPPGGAYDLVGRPLADKLKPLLGTMVIENIGGGGASLGAVAVVRAAADGYTILLGGTQTHVNEALLKSRPLYDPVKDLDPIASVAANCLVIAVHPSVPVGTLKELMAYAKANPGKLSYAHAGVGSIQHLTGELFKSLAQT